MLYIIRHGRTDWNVLHKLQGRTDIPLNDEGRAMARKAAEKYRDIHFDVCFSSPLQRAKETAEILLQGRGVPIITDDRLMEMGFGKFEGAENVLQKPDSPIYALFTAPEKYKAPAEDAESFEELFARTGNFLKEEIQPRLASGQDILIVGHGAMNASILCQMKHLSLEKFWSECMDNCQLIEIE